MTSCRHGRESLVALFAAGIVSAAGCGGPYDATLKGTVTLDGSPLETGYMMFKPIEGGGTVAYARIDQSGDYQARTGREFGLHPGKYAVSVASREKPTVEQSPDGGPPPPGALITPAKYQSPMSSGLSVTVDPGRNTHDIELSSDPSA